MKVCNVALAIRLGSLSSVPGCTDARVARLKPPAVIPAEFDRVQEADRLAALRALHLLDTPPEDRYDRITRLARRVFDVPIALVSLVDADRQWFKSRQGLDGEQTPRTESFCSVAIEKQEILVVPDARLDRRFAHLPMVTGAPHIRFYAGRPLQAPGGQRVGTLCLVDTRPRNLSDEDADLLDDLACIAEQELTSAYMAQTDELTGLLNRRGFGLLARHALSLCQRMEQPACLLFFDLDQFKPINDGYGHAEGDRALREFAAILQGSFRQADVIGRLGGDEFAVLLTPSDEDIADRLLLRVQASVAEFNQERSPGYALQSSCGIVRYRPDRHTDLDDLLAEADAMMYQAKGT